MRQITNLLESGIILNLSSKPFQMKKNIYQTDHTKTPKIFELIRDHQNTAAIEHLERQPEEINLKGWMDHTPLHKAAECGNLDLAKYLIENGAEVNAERSGVYATPLCWSKTLEIAILLLNAGATMNDRELDMATRNDRADIVDELLTRGARINHEEPQFLNCHSVKALEVYLKHEIDLSLTDKNNSSILHRSAWADNVEVFEHAFKKGAKWHKDSSNRTPYVLAKDGGRKKIVQHLQKNYPELTSHRITKVQNPESLPFEQLNFFSEHPEKDDEIIALSKSSKVIKYKSQGNQLIPIDAINIDLPTVRNFTFDEVNNLIIPTSDNKLLKIDSETFSLVASIHFDDVRLDQITFLSEKKIYLSSDGWTNYILDVNFNILNKHAMEDGIFFPLINKDENLVSFYSYDQETYHTIYTLSEKNELKYLHTFFFEWNNSSEGFGFDESGNRFAVSYPKSLSFGEIQGEEIFINWSVDISEFTSEHDLSDLVFINDNVIALAKGKKIILFSSTGIFMSHTALDLKAEIREIKLNYDADKLIVRTHSEIVTVTIERLINSTRDDKDGSEPKTDTAIKNQTWWKKIWL